MRNFKTVLGGKTGTGPRDIHPWMPLARPVGTFVGRRLGRMNRPWLVGGPRLWLGVAIVTLAAIQSLAQCNAVAAVRQAAHTTVVPVAIFGVVSLSLADPMPVAGVHVRVFSAGGPKKAILPTVQTNVAGTFALDAKLSPGKYIFEASKGAVTRRASVSITPSTDWYRVVHIEMANSGHKAMSRAAANRKFGVAVFGQVNKPDGVAPLASAMTAVIRPGKRGADMQFVAGDDTNRLGLFAIRGRIPLGTYGICAAVSGTENMISLSRLDVTASSRRAMIVHLMAGRGLVTGRVVDAKGNPVKGATAYLDGVNRTSRLLHLRAETDAEGRYLFKYVPLGTYVWSVDWKTSSYPPSFVTVGRRPVRKDFQIGGGSRK